MKHGICVWNMSYDIHVSNFARHKFIVQHLSWALSAVREVHSHVWMYVYCSWWSTFKAFKISYEKSWFTISNFFWSNETIDPDIPLAFQYNIISQIRTVPSHLPVTLLSKVFEKNLNKQIRDYFETHPLIGDQQFGFRFGMSTDQLILQLVN